MQCFFFKNRELRIKHIKLPLAIIIYDYFQYTFLHIKLNYLVMAVIKSSFLDGQCFGQPHGRADQCRAAFTVQNEYPQPKCLEPKTAQNFDSLDVKIFVHIKRTILVRGPSLNIKFIQDICSMYTHICVHTQTQPKGNFM